jgi:hypothetical protein
VEIGFGPHPHETNFPPKVIDHLLKPEMIPPLDGVIVFSSRDNDPKREVSACAFLDSSDPPLLVVGQVNVRTKVIHGEWGEVEFFTQETRIPLNEMAGGLVTLRDGAAVVCANVSNPVFMLIKGGQVGVVVEKF